MASSFICTSIDLLSSGGLKVMPVSFVSSLLCTLKSFLIVQASPFSNPVSNFLNCLLSFRDRSSFYQNLLPQGKRIDNLFSHFSACHSLQRVPLALKLNLLFLPQLFLLISVHIVGLVIHQYQFFPFLEPGIHDSLNQYHLVFVPFRANFPGRLTDHKGLFPVEPPLGSCLGHSSAQIG